MTHDNLSEEGFAALSNAAPLKELENPERG